VTDEPGPDFEWRLREAMALKGMWHTSELVAPLAARGIPLSRSQVFRLVSAKPGRVTIPLLLALCDILGCQFHDLVVPVEAPRQQRRRPRTTEERATRRRKRAAGAEGLGPPVPPEFFDDNR
jgi:DNA-binding Xre family transcriptional regulator